MADPMFDLNDALGETYEYGGARVILPESYYPCVLQVVGTGTSEPKMKEVKVKGEVQRDEHGEVLMEMGGDVPYVELAADVYEGPFAGTQISRKVYITPGKSGGGIGRWLGACHAITRQHAMTGTVCQKFGVALPTPDSVRPGANERPEQAYRRAVREALADGFYAMDAPKRLAFIAALLNIVAWDGKRVIVKLGLEQGAQKKRDGVLQFNQDGTPDCYWNNNFDGFLPLDDEKKGLGWVRLVEFPKHEATKVAMAAPASSGA